MKINIHVFVIAVNYFTKLLESLKCTLLLLKLETVFISQKLEI